MEVRIATPNSQAILRGAKTLPSDSRVPLWKSVEAVLKTSSALYFWRRRGRRKVSGDNHAFESALFVSSITEGLVLRLSATAERHLRASAETENLSLRVDDLKISFDLDGPIISNRDFRSRHVVVSRLDGRSLVTYLR